MLFNFLKDSIKNLQIFNLVLSHDLLQLVLNMLVMLALPLLLEV